MTTHPVSKQVSEDTPSLEVIFDLVFAFAASQLSHHLFVNMSWLGALETLVMLVAVFAVWFTTTWSATMISVDQSRTRWLILTVMLLSLFMNSSITKAFTSSGWSFVIPLLLIQFGRLVWMLKNATHPVLREHYYRMLLWVIATSPLWLVGAIVDANERLLWWAMATGIDQIGRWLAHPVPGRQLKSEFVEFDADHLLDRCRQFLIIALGETAVTTGTAITEAPLNVGAIGTGVAALTATVSLWALIFGLPHRHILEHLKNTHDPVRTSRHAINALMVMVAGLIAVAVANEEIISRPYGRTSISSGGPILLLASQGWYLWVVSKVTSKLHLIGGLVLIFVAIIALKTQPYFALVMTASGLAILSLFAR